MERHLNRSGIWEKIGGTKLYRTKTTFAELNRTRDENAQFLKDHKICYSGDSPDWAGTTREEFESVIHSGAHYRADIRTEHLEAKAIDTTTHRQTYRDTTGLYFDIGDAIAGAPEPFFSEIETPRESVLIVVDISASDGISKETMKDRAKKILSIYETHRAKGDAVKVSFVRTAQTHAGDRYMVEIDEVPIDQLSVFHYIACTPAYFRYAAAPFLYRNTGRGGDETQPILPNDQQAMKQITSLFEGKGIYFPGVTNATKDLAAEFIEFDNNN